MGGFTTDDSGKGAIPVTAFGDVRAAELSPQFQGSFEYTVGNTELNTNIEVNGGTVTQASALVSVGTSTTTASTACFQTKRHAKYRAGLGALTRFTALFTPGVADTEQYVGLMDENGSSAAFNNGMAIGYDGAVFGFHRWVNDAKISIDIADWDDPLDGSGITGLTIDLTQLSVWSISFQYLGAGQITLCVENPNTGILTPVHAIKYSNTSATPSSFNPNYHFMIWSNNASTTSDVIIKSASYAFFIEGKTRYFELHQPQFSSGEQSKASVTTEVAIFTLRNKSIYQSKTNFIDLVLEFVSASIEASSANNLGSVRLVRNATLGGVPSYADVNTSDSVVEIDIAGTTVTGGKELLSVDLAGKNDRDSENLVPFDIIIAPGETMTMAGSSANTATIKGSILRKELF